MVESIANICASDLHEWFRGRRKFSNIRHPYLKNYFEATVLPKICSLLGTALLKDEPLRMDSLEVALSDPVTLANFIQEMANSRKISSPEIPLKISMKTSWLQPEDKLRFEVKLQSLLQEFEESTSETGELVTLLVVKAF